jgi:hypothetical protein
MIHSQLAFETRNHRLLHAEDVQQCLASYNARLKGLFPRVVFKMYKSIAAFENCLTTSFTAAFSLTREFVYEYAVHCDVGWLL